MIETIQHFFTATPIGIGIASGFIAAVGADIVAFRSWKTFDDARAYDWKVATFRWVQGVVLGAISGAGLGAIA